MVLTLLACPRCGLQFELESWQKKDGPCGDGHYYCLRKGCKCGCWGKAKKLRTYPVIVQGWAGHNKGRDVRCLKVRRVS